MSYNRWRIGTLDGSIQYVFEMNPRESTTPVPGRDYSWTVHRTNSASNPVNFVNFTGIQGPRKPFEWEFSGILRSQEQYNALVTWTQEKQKLRVETDLIKSDSSRQSFVVRILSLTLRQEARPRLKNAPWRHEYTMKCLLYP